MSTADKAMNKAHEVADKIKQQAAGKIIGAGLEPSKPEDVQPVWSSPTA